MSIDARFTLRHATKDDHARLDACLGGLDLANRDDYIALLRVHGRAISAMERAVEMGKPWTGWSARSSLLMMDLEQLGCAPPPLLETDQPLHTDAELWGAQYVLEGSRLGGKLLLKQVAPAFPHAYLGARQPDAGWRDFQSELQHAAEQGDPDWMDRATQAAIAAFQQFAHAASLELDPARGR